MQNQTERVAAVTRLLQQHDISYSQVRIRKTPSADHISCATRACQAVRASGNCGRPRLAPCTKEKVGDPAAAPRAGAVEGRGERGERGLLGPGDALTRRCFACTQQ